MKVLLVGKDSYIGNHIEEWLSSKGMKVYQLDVLTEEWKSYDYSEFDSIVHVAGIVHRPDCKDWDLYKRVNTDMPIEIATMAKKQGVRQYVFFSTMGVYGIEKRLYPNTIDKSTPLNASSMYSRSKLLAEKGLCKLQDKSFNVAIIRPPSVYGKGCRGNYIPEFSKVVKKIPIIPLAYQNVKQSMIYIDNLCELVSLVIADNYKGIYCPQDERSVSAVEILDAIAKGLNLKRPHSRVFGIIVRLLSFIDIINKAYGGVEYKNNLSNINGYKYVVVPFVEGMRRTVK